MKLCRKTFVLRLLVLVSFFHFTALNNGLASTFCSSEAQSGSADFAPALIRGMWFVANPAVWKTMIPSGRYVRVIERCGRVIECASQKAVQDMLSESVMMQIWISSSLKGKIVKGMELKGEKKGDKAVHEMVNRARKTILENSRGSGGAEWVGYLETNYKESWLNLKKTQYGMGWGKKISSKDLGTSRIASQCEERLKDIKNVGKERRCGLCSAKMAEYICKRFKLKDRMSAGFAQLKIPPQKEALENHPKPMGDFLFYKGSGEEALA